MKRLMICLMAVLLSACFHKDNSPTPIQQPLNLVCVEAANVATATYCNADTSFAGINVRNIDAGNISRGQEISSTSQVQNISLVDESGYLEMTFDAGCGGALEWNIIPKQAFTIISLQTLSITVSGQCGDMPLGARTLTANLYDEDAVTVLTRVIVSFNLVE